MKKWIFVIACIGVSALAIVLAFAFTPKEVVPENAVAKVGKTYYEQEQFVELLTTNELEGNVVIYKDLDLSSVSALQMTKSVNLDLNEKTLTTTADNLPITVGENVTVTLKNGVLEKVSVTVSNKATLNLDNTTIESTGKAITVNGYLPTDETWENKTLHNTNSVGVYGTLNIYNSKITTTGANPAILLNQNAHLTIGMDADDTTRITSEDVVIETQVPDFGLGLNQYVNYSDVPAEKQAKMQTNYDETAGMVVVINGGEFVTDAHSGTNVDRYNCSCIYWKASGSLTINNGKFVATFIDDVVTKWGASLFQKNGTVVVNNGTFQGYDCIKVTREDWHCLGETSCTLNDGKFIGANTSVYYKKSGCDHVTTGFSVTVNENAKLYADCKSDKKVVKASNAGTNFVITINANNIYSKTNTATRPDGYGEWSDAPTDEYYVATKTVTV